MHKLVFWSIFCGWAVAVAQPPTASPPVFTHPLYLGVTGGYGSTTWQGLVPNSENQNLALNISTPVQVKEGGGVWGIWLGYEWSPFFAIEGNYTRYPDATVTFDSMSLFAFENEGQTTLITHTETVSLMGKLMLVIPHTATRLFSSIGIARVLRKDNINRSWQTSPTFGVGLNYELTSHLMSELGGNYTAGYGESELNPANDYIPFLYSIQLKLAYRF